MAHLLIRHNISIPDLQTYYTALWSGDETSFSSIQARGWLTDLEMVGRECVGDTEIGWGSVMVHRAVILPLCPNLARLSLTTDGREDPKIIFSDVPLEVIKSFVQLIYTGSCTLSPVADVTSIWELMRSLGLVIPPDKLAVVNVEAEASELPMISRETVAKKSGGKEKKTKRKSSIDDTIEIVVNMAKRFVDESNEDEMSSKDINCNVKGILRNKSNEPRFSCEHCLFKCRFWTQLEDHSVVHTDVKFSCKKCPFKTSKLINVKNHDRHVHVGKGNYPCDVCGFKALNLIRLKWHKKFHHKKREGAIPNLKKNKSKKSKKDGSTLKVTRTRSGQVKIPEEIFHCHVCEFNTLFQKSLDKHLRRFHDDKF